MHPLNSIHVKHSWKFQKYIKQEEYKIQLILLFSSSCLLLVTQKFSFVEIHFGYWKKGKGPYRIVNVEIDLGKISAKIFYFGWAVQARNFLFSKRRKIKRSCFSFRPGAWKFSLVETKRSRKHSKVFSYPDKTDQVEYSKNKDIFCAGSELWITAKKSTGNKKSTTKSF